jgi:uncharacterized protein YjiS (DUF1127 family)
MSRFGSIAGEFLALCKRIALWPARVAASRAVMAQLAAMNVRELADIGLSPHDVRDATALPLSADPAHILAVRAGEARLRAYERRPAMGSRQKGPDSRAWGRTGS